MTNLNRFKLTGKTALITGGGVGLGQAMAELFAEAGAYVGIHFHSSSAAAESTLARIREAGGDGTLLPADLTKEDEANATVDEFARQAGRLDILVNNAGALIGKARIEDCSLEMWQRTLDVNLTSAFLVTKRAIPHLRATGDGRIVNIASASMQSGGTGGAGAYGVSKGALHVFTRTLCKELAPTVRANCICPGVIETIHHETHSTPEQLETYRKATPLARNGTAEEVATTALYLASDASGFTTGAVLDVNGGRYLR